MFVLSSLCERMFLSHCMHQALVMDMQNLSSTMIAEALMFHVLYIKTPYNVDTEINISSKFFHI